MSVTANRISELALNGVLLSKVSKEEFVGTWTKFFDMHTGGFNKEPWDTILIQAPRTEAINVFLNVFGHNPHDIGCKCCGINYSIVEDEADIGELSESLRGVLLIKASDILEEWKE